MLYSVPLSGISVLDGWEKKEIVDSRTTDICQILSNQLSPVLGIMHRWNQLCERKSVKLRELIYPMEMVPLLVLRAM